MGRIMSLTEALLWIAETFETPAESIKPDTLREAIEAWDSLGALTLMARLDEEFDIVLSDDDLLNMQAVKDILDFFKSHGYLE
jgi:acyl carrier protein